LHGCAAIHVTLEFPLDDLAAGGQFGAGLVGATELLAVGDTWITGGDLSQPVPVHGVNQLKFTDGTNSHGIVFPARINQSRLQQDGVDVTDLIVVNPPG
jgi:hypothetical protein